MNPVVALDIDGTLVDYHRHFTAFAIDYFNLKPLGHPYDARLPFYKYLGVSKVAYRKCKLAYRRGELKRSVPPLYAPYPDAKELTHILRRMGLDIWLCTTRPYLSHDVVDDATRHNLRRNGVLYQGLIWGEHKYRELVRTVGANRVVGVLDDVPAMCQQAVVLGLPTAFAVRQHNELQWAATHEPWVAQVAGVETHEETLALFKSWLTEWRRNHGR